MQSKNAALGIRHVRQVLNMKALFQFLVKGRIDEVIELPRIKSLFPAATGLDSYYPCESECTSKGMDKSVRNKVLEQFLKNQIPSVKPDPAL